VAVTQADARPAIKSSGLGFVASPVGPQAPTFDARPLISPPFIRAIAVSGQGVSPSYTGAGYGASQDRAAGLVPSYSIPVQPADEWAAAHPSKAPINTIQNLWRGR
jgi:hypothetical protein